MPEESFECLAKQYKMLVFFHLGYYHQLAQTSEFKLDTFLVFP